MKVFTVRNGKGRITCETDTVAGLAAYFSRARARPPRGERTYLLQADLRERTAVYDIVMLSTGTVVARAQRVGLSDASVAAIFDELNRHLPASAPEPERFKTSWERIIATAEEEGKIS